MNPRIMLLAFCLCLFAPSLNAQDPTIHLIPTGVITGPTDVVVEGVMPTGGSLLLGAAVIVFQYDPTKVVISNPRVSAGWDAPTTNDNTIAGLYHAVTCNANGQSATGPLLTLTVSPTGASADLSDCSTFQLLGGDQVTDTGSNISASDDNGYYSYYPPGSCGQRGTGIVPTEGTEDRTTESSTDATVEAPSGAGQAAADSEGCAVAIPDVIQILRIAGSLTTSIPVDVDSYDRNADGKITFADAAILLKATCPLIPKGWYSFQGGNLRQGRTFTTIRRAPVSQWTELPLPTEYGYPALERDLMPSVVAVPGINPDYPVLYAVVSDGSTTRLYRIIDNGNSRTSTGYSFPIPGTDPVENHVFEATGTPMVLLRSGEAGKETIIVTGNDGEEAHVFRIDADTTGGQTTFTEVRHRHWPGSILASPGFYAGPLEYVVDDGVNLPTFCPPQVINYGQAVVVAANQLLAANPGENGYLFALDLNDNGKRVWGRVTSNGEALPVYVQSLNRVTAGGLYPFASLAGLYLTATYSGPAIKGQAGYANDSSCYENARDMRTGALLWEAHASNNRVESTTALFEDKLYYGESSSGSIPSIVALQEQADRLGASFWWGLSAANSGINLYHVYPTPAIHAESRSLIFGDDNGNIFGVGTDQHPYQPGMPDARWPHHYLVPPDTRYPGYEIPTPVRCSPLISGVTDGEDTVFVGADDGNLYIFDASSGGIQSSGAPLNVIGPLKGKIRASMAAYNGRLYILTMGDPDATDPSPFLYCYQ